MSAIDIWISKARGSQGRSRRCDHERQVLPHKSGKENGAGAIAIYCLPRSATERPFLVGVMPCF
jgi:hypothetical protein